MTEANKGNEVGQGSVKSLWRPFASGQSASILGRNRPRFVPSSRQRSAIGFGEEKMNPLTLSRDKPVSSHESGDTEYQLTLTSMKSFAFMLSVVLALWIRGTASSEGRGGLRTNINPALLYAQAILAMPDYSAQAYLYTNEWHGRALDQRFGEAMELNDKVFRLLRQAARQTVPCDWGYDLSQGPELLLPSLAKVRSLAQIARLRLRWHLENSRPDDAREDLLAAFILGRQTAKDGVLISALVQVAIENMLATGIAENWFRFSSETLQQVMDGIAAAPVRGNMAECVETERTSMKGWFVRKIEEFQSGSRDEEEAMRKSLNMLRSVMDPGNESPKTAGSPTPDLIVQAAGRTTTGLLTQLKELDALYDEAAVLMTLPYEQFQPRIKAFNEKIATHPNPFVQVFFPAFEKCRSKEFAIETKLAMLHAAHAYRLSGDAGLSRILDPHFHEPFQFRRFQFGGVDRGLELKSKLPTRDGTESLIFVEKDGPAFYLDGKKVGLPLK